MIVCEHAIERWIERVSDNLEELHASLCRAKKVPKRFKQNLNLRDGCSALHDKNIVFLIHKDGKHVITIFLSVKLEKYHRYRQGKKLYSRVNKKRK